MLDLEDGMGAGGDPRLCKDSVCVCVCVCVCARARVPGREVQKIKSTVRRRKQPYLHIISASPGRFPEEVAPEGGRAGRERPLRRMARATELAAQ